ncbi:MAG: DUF2971 domain-containing protein [Ignavibacteria bacterium]|nr:DUF2971 domain-containing protein [Ignavibacteria bacterium]
MSKIKYKDLTSLNYTPSKGIKIFHYCNKKTFWSICKNKSIWLSSIFSMNDSKELSWGRDILTEVLKKHRDEFQQEFRIQLIFIVFSIEKNLLPLIASFSGDGDLLSQWRAYADDGKGFSIGLDASYINDYFPVRLKKVLYNQKEQKRLLFYSLKTFHKYWILNNNKFSGALLEVLIEFSVDIASLKNPTFFEEKEIRLIHLLHKENGNWVDSGGHNSQKDVIPSESVLYRKSRSNNPDVPYINVSFSYCKNNIVKEVIIGPKNKMSEHELNKRLKSLDISEIIINKSQSSYR